MAPEAHEKEVIDSGSTKIATPSWDRRLAERMPTELAREIDIFATQLQLRRQAKIDEDVKYFVGP